MPMMSGDNNNHSEYHHHHHHVPRGCIAILVGQNEERFVIPVTYLNHPKFMVLLNEAEEVYGFRHKGNITLPCDVDEFLNVQSLIEQEIMSTTTCSSHHRISHEQHQNHHHHHHHFLHGSCFKALVD
ncbi:hypothetical protein MKX03_026303 [Papaver bracteatum]|nr:hypothetical protein MKX03_026303 [Papaver bracteatum]